ncbi:MAG: LL-diaminopimelate aminotransferase [Firmicutes bacterium]|nr:LL-diaminopimelate aminotransferase [Bacillota bacterium]
MKINCNYLNLDENYLFQKVNERISSFRIKNKKSKIINLGIGDVKFPLPMSVIESCVKSSYEMASRDTFRGYGPNGGYSFLKEKIQEDYNSKGIHVELDEIFISDGAKSDMSNILDIFSRDNVCLIPDPVYPVYLDTNIMDGRKIIFLNASEENNFLPEPYTELKADIIYICSPNNPTGAVYSKLQLKKWVDFANNRNAVILFDSAYESFISEEELPKSIFEIEGSNSCAIEFKSFSKAAGFTGMRCGYTIIFKELIRENISLNSLWDRRHSTKFNGVPYIIQRAAEASLSSKGKEDYKNILLYYKENARIISDVLADISIEFFGGKNSPYIWLKCPNKMKSWDFFDYLLENLNIVGTPGSGFGKNGEYYFRLSCFGEREEILAASKKLKDMPF